MPQLQNSTPDPTLPTMMGGSPDAAMGMPSGPTGPIDMPTSPEVLPEAPQADLSSVGTEAPSGDGKTDGLKRQLLQKMMENLLNKPGRSVNELVNGVKAVIGAYKNYAKEWDNLSGITEAPLAPEGSSSPAGGSSDIQDILRKIQEQKGGGVDQTPAAGDSSMAPTPGGSAVPPPLPIGPMDKGPSGLGGPGYISQPRVNSLGTWVN